MAVIQRATVKIYCQDGVLIGLDYKMIGQAPEHVGVFDFQYFPAVDVNYLI